MWGLAITIVCMLIENCFLATLPPWAEDDVSRTKVPDPWVVTTVAQPSLHQPIQPSLERPPVLQGGFTQGQWEYIKGLLQGLKSTVLTNMHGSSLTEHISDDSGTNSEYTQIKGYVCVGYKACPGDRRYYLEFDSVSWVKRPCPYGYTFDDRTCYCSNELQAAASTTLGSPSNTVKIRITTPVPASTAAATNTTTSTTQKSLAPTTSNNTTTSTNQNSLAPATSSNAITFTTQKSVAPTTFTTTVLNTTQIANTGADTTTSAPVTSRDGITTRESVSNTEITTLGITVPISQLCNSAVILNSSGLTRLPGSCDIFVHCRFVGDTPSPKNTRRCPDGLLWNQDTLTCDYARNVKCQSESSCYNKQAVPENKGEYLLLTKTGWVVSFCPDGMGFNLSTCSCSDKFVYEHLHPHCPDKIPISDDPRGFLEFDGVAWMYVPCPDTLLYDHSSCACEFPQADPYMNAELKK